MTIRVNEKTFPTNLFTGIESKFSSGGGELSLKSIRAHAWGHVALYLPDVLVELREQEACIYHTRAGERPSRLQAKTERTMKGPLSMAESHSFNQAAMGCIPSEGNGF